MGLLEGTAVGAIVGWKVKSGPREGVLEVGLPVGLTVGARVVGWGCVGFKVAVGVGVVGLKKVGLDEEGTELVGLDDEVVGKPVGVVVGLGDGEDVYNISGLEDGTAVV